MKKIHRVLALLMAALMAFGLMTTAFAAEPTIDASKKASLSIYKYDITKASEDGVWDSLVEVATDKGYVLLKDAVKIIIKTAENGQCEKCGAKLLTASATVNGKDVTMTDGNAIVPLTVINNPGFDLPKTGGYGTWMFTIGGVALLGAAAFIVIRSRKHKNA